MLYPRKDEKGELVDVSALVGFREHLATKHRLIALQGDMNPELDSTMLLFAFDSLGHEPIKMIIDSNGGSLDMAFLLYDNIKLLETPIYTLGRVCYSAAVIPLAAGKKRYLMPHAKVMLHLPSNYYLKDTTVPIQDMEIHQKEMINYRNQLVEILQECGVKKDKKDILKDIDREFWLNPKEAIEYGLADEIITPSILKEWLT